MLMCCAVFMVWIEKDLSAVTKAVYDNWDEKSKELQYNHLFVSGGRTTYEEMTQTIEQGERSSESIVVGTH